MDSLYANIGVKLKRLAQVLFIMETIAAVAGGIALIAIDEDWMVLGLLVLFVGPFVAYIASWFLYAFGELVDKTSRNENNARIIIKFLKDSQAQTKEQQAAPQEVVSQPAYTPNIDEAIGQEQETIYVRNTIVCPQCNIELPRGRQICWNCGTKLVEEDA